MDDNRTGGWLLVAGCAAGLITMGFHPMGPHGGGLLPPAGMAAFATYDRVVHGLGLTSVALTFLGSIALTQRLATQNRLALAALVLVGFATVSILIAGAMDGFVSADILSRMVEGDPKLESRRMMLDYTFRINQAFAAIYTVATCAAIFLWSLAMRQIRCGPASLWWYGLVLAPLMVTTLLSGRLPLDVHGFGLVALTHAIWFIAAGREMIVSRDSPPRKAAPYGACGAGAAP